MSLLETLEAVLNNIPTHLGDQGRREEFFLGGGGRWGEEVQKRQFYSIQMLKLTQLGKNNKDVL